MTQPASLEILVECANSVADILHVAHPSHADVLRVIDYVVAERSAVIGAEMGIITWDESALLLLSHFHSSLFANVAPPEDEPWTKQEILDRVKQGLFGTSDPRLNARQG